jgi:hypothetical protein
MMRGRIATCVALASVAGCNSLTSLLTNDFETNGFSGDPYPIEVDTSSGALMVGASVGDGNRTAVVDVLSPITLIDRGRNTPPRIDDIDLEVLGARGPGGALDLPRAVFSQPQVATLHPCSDDTCQVGTPTDLRAFDALLGMNIFNSDALRLHFIEQRAGHDQIFILPNVAGDEPSRTQACDAVFPTPFRGGGTMLIGGTELQFTNWRIAIATCLAPRPETPGLPQRLRGVDVLLIASTSIGTSILGESAYARYQEVYTDAPTLANLPDFTEYLPSGPVTGKLATIPSLALVADSAGNPLAPCREVYASHLLAQDDCQAGDDCPCTGATFCLVPAIVEIAPQTPKPGIEFLIVADDNDTLQALRAELRPDQPEVDGLLGTSAMRTFELDIDYPDNQLLARCNEQELVRHGTLACKARPEIDLQGDTGARGSVRKTIDACIGTVPGPLPH